MTEIKSDNSDSSNGFGSHEKGSDFDPNGDNGDNGDKSTQLGKILVNDKI